jgi:hypothetical protein
MIEEDYKIRVDYGLMLIEQHTNLYIDWERNTCKSSICKEYIIKCVEDPTNDKYITVVYDKSMSCRFLRDQILKKLTHRNIIHRNVSKQLVINNTTIEFIQTSEFLKCMFLPGGSKDSIYIFDEVSAYDTIALSNLLAPYLTPNIPNKHQFIFSKSTGMGNPVSIITSTFEYFKKPIHHSKTKDMVGEIRRLKIKKIMDNIK